MEAVSPPDSLECALDEGTEDAPNPYLMFDGQCEAAFRFYEQALGGRIAAMMTFADTPMAEQTPPETQGKIIHARLVVGDKC